MIEVKKSDIGGNKNNTRDEIIMYLWLTGTRKDGSVWKKIFGFNVNEAIGIKDDGMKILLSNQDGYIIPKQVNDFDLYLSKFIRIVYQETELIMSEEYIEFCLSRLGVYEKIFYNRRHICELFYERYMPYNIKERYHNFEEMFNANKEVIEIEVKPYYETVGGDFVGCYTDNNERVRPITSPKQRIKRYDYIEELKVCIRREIGNESK